MVHFHFLGPSLMLVSPFSLFSLFDAISQHYFSHSHTRTHTHTHTLPLSLSTGVQFSSFAHLTAQPASFVLSLLLFLSRCLAASAPTEETSLSRASRPRPFVSCLPHLHWGTASWPHSPVVALLLTGSSRPWPASSQRRIWRCLRSWGTAPLV